MRYNTRYRYTSFFSSGYFPDGVKWLLIINTLIFLPFYMSGTVRMHFLPLFALVPDLVIHNFFIWQLFTYMFLHGSIWHLLVNMFTLWMFGITLEQTWGTRRFLKYFFFCGIAAGVCDVAVNGLLGNWGSHTIGASGGIYGLLLAFGVLFPDQTILFSFLFPIKAKYFVMIYGAIALLGALNVNSGVSEAAHLGGMVFGYLYLKARVPTVGMEDVRRRYRAWKMERARKKFQVYMRKHGNRGPWTN